MLAVPLLGACSGDDGGTPILDLEVDEDAGTCLMVADDAGPEVKDLPVVPCAEPHTHELYAVIEFEGDVFPGLEALEAFAEPRCLAEFRDFVGIHAFDSSLAFSWILPTLSSWNDHDDKAVLCVLGNFQGGQLQGSMRNANI